VDFSIATVVTVVVAVGLDVLGVKRRWSNPLFPGDDPR
jgi:hypothetical protein